MSEVTEHAPGTPSWADLATSDAEAAKGFYTALFGWTGETAGEEAGFYTVLSKDGKPAAALFPVGPDQGSPRWNTYVTVADLDAAVDKVEPAGGVVIAPPFDVFDAGRMAVVSDPTGAVVSLWEARTHIGASVVNEPGALCWNELITGDRDRAAAFYGALFGWSSRTDQLGPMTYTEFKNGETSVAGMTEMHGIPPHWGVYFAVESADATIERATALGASVVRPAMDLLVGRMAALVDPQGAVFSVIQLAEPSA